MPTDLNRRDFVKNATVAATAASVARGRAEQQPAQRPNILWLVSEDTGPELGCYGYPLVHTPNLDRLAAEGVRFTNAVTNAPVCSASRSSFMTGMYCTSIGAHNHRSHRGDGFGLPEGVHVFTKYLRDAGYFTALCGNRKTDWNFTDSEKPYDSFAWEDLKAHQPFFAQYQFTETHRAFRRCPEHPVDPAKVTLPPCYPDHPVAREDWALYLEDVNVLDQKIGEVLKKLDADGLADNTLVFYFGDHGHPHIRGKQFLYEGGIHIPLVIRWPGHLQPGAVEDELVSALDFAPTMLDLTGAPVPKHLQGRVFLGPHKQPEPEYVFATRDRCDETVDRLRCVRDRRHKYIRNFRDAPNLLLPSDIEETFPPATRRPDGFAPRPKQELYDLSADGGEERNLVDSPAHADILAVLRRRLGEWMEQTADLILSAEIIPYPPEQFGR